MKRHVNYSFFILYLMFVAAPLLGAAGIESPQTFFASCLSDPFMHEFAVIKAAEIKYADKLSGALYIPKINLRAIAAPIEGVRGDTTSYRKTSWGPFFSFRVEAAWIFYYFGAEFLASEGRRMFEQWAGRSQTEKTHLFLKTLTEGYLQLSFFHYVRRDFRNILRNLKEKERHAGMIQTTELAYATLQNMDAAIATQQHALASMLTQACPSLANRFEDPDAFWGGRFEGWHQTMRNAAMAEAVSETQFIDQSSDVFQQKTEIQKLIAEEALSARPRLFVGALWDSTVAPTRSDSTNPFVSDGTNDITLGIGVGLDWQFDLFPIRARRLQIQTLKENLFFTTQQARQRYYEMEAIRKTLTQRHEEMIRQRERLDSVKTVILRHARNNTLDRVSDKSFENFFRYYEIVMQAAVQYYKDLATLYFSDKNVRF